MEDAEYWFVKCKLCPNFHKGQVVNRREPKLNIPIDQAIECPTPGAIAEYRLDDWRGMTESQWLE